jgi:ATP-dependent protease HslVU (ClpYQ) peptidase subunit
MTVVVAVLSDENDVIIGSDSAGISETDLEIRKDPKLFVKNGCIFGFCGSYRVCQLVRYHFSFPTFHAHDKVDPLEYMVTKFIVPLRTLLKEYEVDKESEDFSFIIGFKKHIFTVSADLQVAEQRDGFCAIGAGAQIAKGALYVAKKAGCFSAKNAVVMGLKAAERYCTDVRGPFEIDSI